MDKRIVVGLISGLIFGVLEMLILSKDGGGYLWLILPTVLGGLIGWVNSMRTGLNFFLLSALVGAAFFVLIALNTNKWADDIVTGAITGLLIGLVIHFVGPKLLR